MAARRVSFQEHEDALAVCAKIKAKHPDILERLPDGLYRCMLAGPDEREALFIYLACERVAAAWAAKRKARDADLARLQSAVAKY